MENVWVLASVWVGLALIAMLVAIWFKISIALTEIAVGAVAQLIIGAFFVHGELGAKTPWVTFLAGTGAIVFTFLAGAALVPQIFRMKWKAATVIGLMGFFAPFFGYPIAHFILHWTFRSSWLAGVALSTTPVAVVRAVMLELPSTSRILERRWRRYSMTPRSTLRKALGRYKGHEIDLQTATAVGHPAEQIIYRAEADGIDLIILGRRGALDDLQG
jgi:hypothetical protein